MSKEEINWLTPYEIIQGNPNGNGNGAGNGNPDYGNAPDKIPDNPNIPIIPESSSILFCVLILIFLSFYHFNRKKNK